MSLDIDLIVDRVGKNGTGIYYSLGDQVTELLVTEWNKAFPDKTLILPQITCEAVFSANITHNLTKMADAAGIYETIWQPETLGFVIAEQLIKPLAEGRSALYHNPGRFSMYNPENGWGSYSTLVRLVEDYLKACIEFPKARIDARG